MKEPEKKFNLIDYFIIISIVLLIVSAVLQYLAVNNFEEKYSFRDVFITFKLVDVDENTFAEIEKGDYIFSNAFFGHDSIGVVEQKIIHSLSDNEPDSDTAEKNSVEYMIRIKTRCLKNNDGFYSINNKLIVPGSELSADNGFVGFNCEIASIDAVE